MARPPWRGLRGAASVARPESARGFVPVAKRWVVERTIAWTNFFRRIVKDYEYTLSSSVNWLYLANIQLMLQRI
nr:transposase [Spirosoma fluviale]